MPRIFSGLEVPAPLRLRLSMVRSQVHGAKWIAPDDMHITLRFAGDVTKAEADEFYELLDDIEEPPFPVRIKGVGVFGGRDPKVLWAGVDGGEPLARLQRAHERAARFAGLKSDGHPFHAHVTLARLRGARVDEVARFLEENGDFRAEPFTAERFVVFSARPGSGGGPYAVEAAFGLGVGEDFEQQDLG
jgi:RNA 2',3'-cyclic 3'-phosphodiesterase